ncbi:double-stranded RNA-binding protein 2-like [Gastrolobium bilobum]|uniref:double-stranded RNA-binding protein 2-like n=1 Tax=Gastrolobium bilobum TaxID=150636 RepID=UPI002AAF2657|nr:double-stranded RNA-binding protein 2-like [Gastrolobium bilobum]
MYKNQLQELAQRSCFNLPSYTCIREGPDHAPRFKATVNFNGEIFESPQYCSTLRQAEHSAAEVALNSLSHRGPSHSLAARILDETGVYKNLLQEIAQRVGAPLPQYTTFRSGLGHLPVFTGTVELAGITFTGEPAKNKKQAEKNAAMASWSSLKQLAKETARSSTEPENNDELEQITIARALMNYRQKEKMAMSNPNAPIPFPKTFHIQNARPTSPQPPPATTSKILPLICRKTSPRSRHPVAAVASDNFMMPPLSCTLESRGNRRPKFPAAGAAPYVPIRQIRSPCQGIAPPVTVRTAVPVFSPPPATISHQVMRVPPHVRVAPPVNIRQAVPVYAAPSVQKEQVVPVYAGTPVQKEQAVPVHAASPIQKDEQAIPVYAAPPVQKEQAVPVHAASPIQKDEQANPVYAAQPVQKDEQAIPVYVDLPVQKDEPVPIRKDDLPAISAQSQEDELPAKTQETDTKTENIPPESETVQSLEQLKI